MDYLTRKLVESAESDLVIGFYDIAWMMHQANIPEIRLAIQSAIVENPQLPEDEMAQEALQDQLSALCGSVDREDWDDVKRFQPGVDITSMASIRRFLRG